ncbi:shikimate dehydrogenase [Candidatus Pelagibacter sp. Uisw_092]|jgi:shikimate dehydrogenase|uniref:shikimate dehydrogenase n=1 Tax=Candidatus Pelagibacter sp. Uisw_092 TaxID=3230979 RepID=UPI0039EB721C
MKKYLVIGNPIEHSQSPLIHNYWMEKYRLLDSVYEKRKIEKKDLKDVIKELKDEKIAGVNVTVPFKKSIIPYIDELDQTANNTQSVNTLHKEDNKVVGYNTDTLGFLKTIHDHYNFATTELAVDAPIRNFFILGAGGVTPSIVASLQFLVGRSPGVIWVSNRSKNNANQLKKLFPKIELIEWGECPSVFCDIVVNTTSVGLKKDDKINIDFTDVDKKTLFYDLIYSPKETKFLRDARLRGNKTINGQMMFLVQAREAFRIWTNITPEIDDEVIRLLNK